MARRRIKNALVNRSWQRFDMAMILTTVLLIRRRNLREQGPPVGVSRALLICAIGFLHGHAADMAAAHPAPYRRPSTRGLERILGTIGGEAHVWNRLRFSLADVRRIAEHFLPAMIALPHRRGSVNRYDAMATVLLRLADPASAEAIEPVCGYPDWLLSSIVRTTVERIVDDWYRCIASPPWLNDERLTRYAERLTQAGCPIPTIAGFMDGTRRVASHPRDGEECWYNGWLHNHTMLFIATAFPDGTFLLRGPVSGRWNDINALSSTGLDTDLPELLGGHAVGADGVFPIQPHVIGMDVHMEGLVDAEHKAGSSSTRVAVERLFGSISNVFRSLRNKDPQRLMVSIPALTYQAGAVLALARTCLYGNTLGSVFDMPPPALQVCFPPRAG
eukprot:TRINITY_DN8627_c0_g2_i1.p2 TRINITY_DN8627_c0_g2~~TRINITY_DN8627_c0_g2_i1.p2  ORF type:complete len:389 (+),score=43.56 TRINITY_DN8627_c0_g2_i1:182-1348(+)